MADGSEEVRTFFDSINLGNLADTFIGNGINGYGALQLVTEETLDELGIHALAKQKILSELEIHADDGDVEIASSRVLTPAELSEVTAWQDSMNAATLQMKQWAAAQVQANRELLSEVNIIHVNAVGTGELLASPSVGKQDTVLDLARAVMRESPMPLRPTLRLNEAVLDPLALLSSLDIDKESIISAEVHAAIVTCSEDTTSKVWDAETGKCELHLRGHTGSVNFACFAPDCSILATCSDDCTAKLWSLSLGDCLHTLRGHTDFVTCAVFAPNGSSLVTGSQDCSAKVWNPFNGSCLHTLKAHAAAVYSIAFDGNLIMTCSRDRTTVVWDARSGKYLRSEYKEPVAVELCTYAPGGRLTVTTAYDREAKVWNTHTGMCEMVLRGHEGQVICAIFSPECIGMQPL